MLIAVWPLVVMILGLVMYLITANPKTSEIGRLTFFVGALWLVFTLISRTPLHLG